MDLTDPTPAENSRLRRVLGTDPYRPPGSESAPAAPAAAVPPAAPVDQVTRPGPVELDGGDGGERVAARRRPASKESTLGDFTGQAVPAQFKLPADLVQSLRLHAISRNVTMSELVLECLTGPEFVGKAWVSTRRAA